MKVLRSRVIVVLLLIIGCVAVATVGAQEVNVSKRGVAIEGYDVVAYHTENEAVLGSRGISTTWNDVRWYFASEENRELFVANPEQYAPEYGGYCAYAAANDAIAPVDPRAFSVVDEKLYLNFNHTIRNRWSRNANGYIESADENWPGLLTQLRGSSDEAMEDMGDMEESMEDMDDMEESIEETDE